MTFPTKVPSDSLGWIGSLKRTSDKSLFPMALGSCGHRITHQLRPINMNGRSILAVTSIIGNRAGVGKEMLVHIASIIATGRPCPATSFPVDKDEARKVKVALPTFVWARNTVRMTTDRWKNPRKSAIF